MTWTIHTDADGTLTAGSKAPPIVTPGRGETVALSFAFRSKSDYQTLRHYLDYAGASASMVTLDGEPRYRELQTGKSLLLGFEPPRSDMDGLYGLLVGGSDQTELTWSRMALDLKVLYLAEFDDYASLADVRSAFEV